MNPKKITSNLERLLPIVMDDDRKLHEYLHYLYLLKDNGEQRDFYKYETKLQERFYTIFDAVSGMGEEW